MVDKIYDIKERTYQYSLDVLKFTRLASSGLNNAVLVKQLVRSATSIGANVAEGQAGSSKKDFVNYYLIALKSANESIYWLNLLKDTNEELTEKIATLVEETEEISKVLGKIIVNCKK